MVILSQIWWSMWLWKGNCLVFMYYMHLLTIGVKNLEKWCILYANYYGICLCKFLVKQYFYSSAQLAGTVEYANCISTDAN